MIKKFLSLFKKSKSYDEYLAECKENGQTPLSKVDYEATLPKKKCL